MCQNRSNRESTMNYIYEPNFRGIHGPVFWKLQYFENLVKNVGHSSVNDQLFYQVDAKYVWSFKSLQSNFLENFLRYRVLQFCLTG